MADSSEPAFLFLYRKEAVAPVDYLSTFATAPSEFTVRFMLRSVPHPEGILPLHEADYPAPYNH